MQGGQEELLIARAAPALVADVLRRFGRVRLRVTGHSMFPAIRPGDVIHVGHCAVDGLEPGDVALVAAGSRLFAHRVIAVGSKRLSFFVTRGDSLVGRDPPAVPDQLLGRVESVCRAGVVRPPPIAPSSAVRVFGIVACEWIRLRLRIRALLNEGCSVCCGPRRASALSVTTHDMSRRAEDARRSAERPEKKFDGPLHNFGKGPIFSGRWRSRHRAGNTEG